MTFVRGIPFAFFLAVLFTGAPAPARAENGSGGSEPRAVEAFHKELGLAARRAAGLKTDRLTKVKAINDSYRLTAQAVRVLDGSGDPREAIALLREAVRKLDSNRLAYLLLGAIFEKADQPEEAARVYADFYRYSLALSPVENQLIGPQALEVFREYVEIRFRQWGRSLPEPKVPLGVRRARSLTLLENSGIARKLNLILPILAVGGLVLLMLLRVSGLEVPALLGYFLGRLYLLAVLSYALWAAHFYLGLPFWGSMEAEFGRVGGFGFAAVTVLTAMRYWRDERAKITEGLAACPHCRAVVSKLCVECPECKRRWS
ncbi:MAG: hypothetical protein WC352_02510 [Candidatus Omnitrophota bacterium]|jgi:hypothetical protein